MNKVIRLAVTRPLICLSLLLVLTGFFFLGMKELRMEPSTEALMPKHVEEYRYNMRMKKVFGDSKLYLLCLIESRKGELMTHENFLLLNDLVEEIEEFHSFDYKYENDRLQTVIDMGSLSYVEDNIAGSTNTSDELSDEEIEALLTGDSTNEGEAERLQNTYFDVFAIDDPLPDDIYVTALRGRREYSLASYTPVTYRELNKALDSDGRRQLQTILVRMDLAKVSEVYSFSPEEYGRLIDEFESAYLYKSMEAVKSFMNPVTGEDIVGTEDSLIPVDFVEIDDSGVRMLPEGDSDFKAYKARLLANPGYRDTVYTLGEDGSISALAMNIQLQVIEDSDYIRDYFMDVFEKHSRDNLGV